MNEKEIPRKASQEVEIDHLLAEEFCCDPDFLSRFLAAAKLPAIEGQVVDAIAEPKLEEGYGDLRVEIENDAGIQSTLLIEDKIDAGPATRQAERYATHAEELREEGRVDVYCILVAPNSYIGESDDYDAKVTLEDLVGMIQSPDVKRQDWRRKIVQRAIRKKRERASNPDPKMDDLRSEYRELAEKWFKAKNLLITIPSSPSAGGNSWVFPEHEGLPDHVELRHQLWTTYKAKCGTVDLIIKSSNETERRLCKQKLPKDAIFSMYPERPRVTQAGDKGIKIFIQVPEMRQEGGFSEDVGTKALEAMVQLCEWYLEEISPHLPLTQ